MSNVAQRIILRAHFKALTELLIKIEHEKNFSVLEHSTHFLLTKLYQALIHYFENDSNNKFLSFLEKDIL